MTTVDSPLLALLTAEQQRLVDLVAEAFLQESYEWPIFHYIEWMLDEEGLDAWDLLRSLPQVGRWGYGPIAWVRSAPTMKPTPESEVALTVVGIAKSSRLCSHLQTFFLLLEYMAGQRRSARPSPREYVEPTASSDGFSDFCRASRRLEIPHPRLTWQLLEREPPGVFGSRSYDPDNHAWTRAVPREALELEGVDTITEYVRRLDRWLIVHESTASFSAPAIPLPTAIDHLNDVWRLTFGAPLFHLSSAERLASLTQEISTQGEYEARLSAVGDLLRSANATLGKGERKRARDKLSHLQGDVFSKISEDAQARASEAIQSLEAVLALRDSRQHGSASHRAMAGAQQLGVPYPTSDWAAAWQTVSARIVESFGAIADELRVTLD